MDNYKVAKELAEVLSQRKASDVVLIDIAEKSSFADYFINCTASSERQLGALQESVEGLRGKVRKQLDPRGLR